MKTIVQQFFQNLPSDRHPSAENPRIMVGVDYNGVVRSVYLCTGRTGGVVLMDTTHQTGHVYKEGEGRTWVQMCGPRGQNSSSYRFLQPGEKIVLELQG